MDGIMSKLALCFCKIGLCSKLIFAKPIKEKYNKEKYMTPPREKAPDVPEEVL